MAAVAVVGLGRQWRQIDNGWGDDDGRGGGISRVRALLWRRRPSFPSEAILTVCCSQRPPLASAVIVGVGGRR